MISLPSQIYLLYFSIGASALAVNYGPSTSTSSLVSLADTLRQTPTAISGKDILQDPTFTSQSQTTSTDDYPPVALQSATGIARPSLAVTSLARSLSGVHAEPQSYSINGIRPSAPAPELRSEGSTRLPSYYAGVISSQLPTDTTGPRLLVTTSANTQSTTGLDRILVAIGQVASKIEQTAALPSGSTETMSGSQSQDQPENALSVLLSALPVDVASSIEAGFSVVTHDLLATSNAETSRPTSLPSPSSGIDRITTSTSRTDHRPTTSREDGRPSSSRYTARPIPDTSASRPTRHPEKSHTSSNTSRPTSRPTTLTTRPSTTPTPTLSTVSTLSSSSSSSSTNPPPTAQDTKTQPPETISPEKQRANGTIAGIATGATAALVLLTLAIFFLLRRRKRQTALKALADKANHPYPEVAFLYDPVQSPPRSRSPAPLLADVGTGAGSVGTLGTGVVGSRRESGMTAQTQAQRSSLLAPEVVVMPPEGEPLLAPGRAATRENSPNGMGR